MKIVKIIRKQRTSEEDYTLITFKTWWGKEFTELCISPDRRNSTHYAKNGIKISVSLWDVVRSFLRTSDEIHEY